MFRGKYLHTIDPKGRLSIPARFREEMTTRGIDTLVLTEGDHCVWAFPLDEWERFEEKMRQQPQLSPEMRSLLRMMVASAKDCPVDRAGRTLVPPDLRDFARLQKNVMITGALTRFEIWNSDRWHEVYDRLRGGFDENTRRLSELGL